MAVRLSEVYMNSWDAKKHRESSRTRRLKSENVISSYGNAIQKVTNAIPEMVDALLKSEIAIHRKMAFVSCRRQTKDWLSRQTKEMTMARKSRGQRKQEQQERQAAVRAKAKATRRPGRDDFARVLFWQMIRAAQRDQDPRQKLDRLRDKLTEVLESQGFNLKEAEDVFEDLAKKYSNGLNPFRPKFHIVYPPE